MWCSAGKPPVVWEPHSYVTRGKQCAEPSGHSYDPVIWTPFEGEAPSCICQEFAQFSAIVKDTEVVVVVVVVVVVGGGFD